MKERFASLITALITALTLRVSLLTPKAFAAAPDSPFCSKSQKSWYNEIAYRRNEKAWRCHL